MFVAAPSVPLRTVSVSTSINKLGPPSRASAHPDRSCRSVPGVEDALSALRAAETGPRGFVPRMQVPGLVGAIAGLRAPSAA